MFRCHKESLAPAKKKTSGWIQGEERTLESLLDDHQRWLRETGGDRSVSPFLNCLTLMTTLIILLMTLFPVQAAPEAVWEL